jgi:hypothetical protein
VISPFSFLPSQRYKIFAIYLIYLSALGRFRGVMLKVRK